jgi:hypothetical protein
MNGVSTPANWSTWWVLDGNDTRDAITTMDNVARLNAQVVEVQAAPWYSDAAGVPIRFQCFITGIHPRFHPQVRIVQWNAPYEVGKTGV